MMRIRYGYVVATAFSGTTLLSMLLDGHPRIVSIGEVNNTIDKIVRDGRCDAYPCSCGQPIRECAFFRQIQNHCARHGIALDLHDFQTQLGAQLGHTTRRILFGSPQRAVWLQRSRDALVASLPAYRRHTDRIFDRTVAIARAAVEVSGKDIFLDTSKSVARVPHLHRRSEVDLRVIHVVRDVRAFVRSRMKRGGRTAAGAARTWVRTHETALRLVRLVGEEHYLRFRWEDFCANPQPVLDCTCAFLGAEPAELVSRVNAQPHHVVGNKMRLDPIRPIRSDESWRETLETGQLAACERIAGELNRRFGYR